MEAGEKMLQMNAIKEESTSLYKILLACIQSRRLAAFKSVLKRDCEIRSLCIDINHVYTHPLSKTLLDVACCEGLHEFVKHLLQLGADPNKLNVAHNRSPIHFAAELGHVDVLRVLLEDSKTNPNLEAGRETALHFAAMKNNIECVKLLLDNNASPNIANAKGTTPIYIAAAAGRREMVDTFLYSSRLAPDLDNSWDFKKKTPRNLIADKFPDIQLPSKSKINIDFNVLRFYLDANDEKHFLDNLTNVKDHQQTIDEPRLIVIAASRNFHIAVKELLIRKKDEDLNYNLCEAAQVAIKCGHPNVLVELLHTNTLQITEKMLITSCKELEIPPLRSNKKQSDRLKCLKLILDQPDINVRCEDDKGNTPLHYAARADCAEAVSLLLKCGSYLGHVNILGIPPLAHIAPSILEEYFDDCLGSNNDRTDDYEINYDYTCLVPHTMIAINSEYTSNNLNQSNNFSINSPSKSEMDVLHYIASNRTLKNLLKHPLLSSYLYLKWHRIRHVLYVNFIFYILFYIFLNCYILLITIKSEPSNQKYGVGMNDSNMTASRTVLTMWGRMSGLWCSLAIFLTVLLLREVLQFISSPRDYIISSENWLEIMLIMLTIAILTGAGPPVGAIAILLSAWELVILISQHPRMSTGIEMFKTVSVNLMLFLLPYAFLILAFALAFFTLFKDGDESNFPDPGHSLFKTIIMLTGEFDANDIPFVSHPILSHFIFVFFVFLIAIVLFNLLIGLAVSDTADILSKAELVELISRTKLISYAERIVVGSTNITKSTEYWNNRCQQQIFAFNFLVRRLLVFPRYLPHAKIAVKLYKNNEVRIYGCNQNRKKCTTLMMDSRIVLNSKAILSVRGKVTECERIMNSLQKLQSNMIQIEDVLNNIMLTLRNEN